MRDFLMIADFKNLDELNDIRLKTTKILGSNVCFAFYVDAKKTPDNLKDEEKLTFLSKEDLNFFGKWKSEKALNIISQKEKVVLVYQKNFSAKLNKLLLKSESILKIGKYKTEGINFELEIMGDGEDLSAYLEKVKKYLNKI